MSPAESQSSPLAAEWRDARLLYPLYVALAQEFVLDLPPCNDLEAPADIPDQDTMTRSREWFALMDGRIQVHQLRQFLQTTPLATEEVVQGLLTRHLNKPNRNDPDRDKIDFLLVQFFSLRTPSRLEDSDVDLAYVAQVLEPVLGDVEVTEPAWLRPHNGILSAAQACTRLSELLEGGILDQGRKLKVGAAQNYFLPAAMVAFARFSFLMRRVFFRLMHDDLNAILDGLRDLEHRGLETVDCRRAQFSRQEPIVRLRMICQSWKVMFHAEYSSGQPLKMLVDLRAAVEEALSSSGGTGKPARAQAAAAAFNVAPAGAPEFQVEAPTPSWDPESGHGSGGGK
jgi:hypothetical protein